MANEAKCNISYHTQDMLPHYLAKCQKLLYPVKCQTACSLTSLAADNRFSKFFHCVTKHKVNNNNFMVFPAAPKMCYHTTLGNAKFKFA